MNTNQTDRALIDALGGPKKLAERLNLGKFGAQRVSNWKARGIPPAVKLSYPKIFLTNLMQGKPKALANTTQPATETVAHGE